MAMSEHAPSPAVDRLAVRLQPVAEAVIGSAEGLPVGLDPVYVRFLTNCAGGYTADHLWHFFGLCGPPEHHVVEWNSPSLWKATFGLDERFFVFAEDILGNQYGFVRRETWQRVKMLSVVTGELTVAPYPFPAFVECMVLEPGALPEMAALAGAYFETTGQAYRPFHHLEYLVPPILGGEQDVTNVALTASVSNLKVAGQVLTQVKQLPPGTRITRVTADAETRTIQLHTEPPQQAGLWSRLRDTLRGRRDA
jgi:hypothetical protein